VQVGNSLNAYITVIGASRDGARLGAQGGADDDQIRALVVSAAGRLAGGVDPKKDVEIEHTKVDGVEAVSVTVCNDHKPMLDVRLVLPDTFRMCSTTSMRVLDN
jgi:hypothetical protein